MSESRVPAVVKMCGHMGVVGQESESSSDESSQGTIELDFEEPDTASHSSAIENASVKERLSASCELDGVMVSSLSSPPTPNEEERTRCGSRVKAAGIVDKKERIGHQPVDNAFGIPYKPCGVSSQGYTLPSGPAFVDEDEFEQEMGAEFRVMASTSEGGGQTRTTSDITQSRNSNAVADTDDFFSGERMAGDAGMAQQEASYVKKNCTIARTTEQYYWGPDSTRSC